MGGGCQVPIGTNASWQGGKLHLQAVVTSPDGKVVLRESGTGESPIALGEAVGDKLLNKGGAAILEAVYGHDTALPEQP